MIRAAEACDAPEVAALWNWMIRDTLATFTPVEKTDSEIATMIAARAGAFYVAQEEGAVHGFATFGAFRAGPGYAATCEHSIVLQPRMRRQGLGRALMVRLEAAARAQEMHVMIAAISGVNLAAIGFHAALGFVETGRLPEVGRKSGQWLDLVLMQKYMHPGV